MQRKHVIFGVLFIALTVWLAGCRSKVTQGGTSPAIDVSTPVPSLNSFSTLMPASPTVLPLARPGGHTPAPNPSAPETGSPTILPTVLSGTQPSVPDATALATDTQIILPTVTPITPPDEPNSPASTPGTAPLPPAPTETAAPIPVSLPTPLDRPIQGMILFNISSAKELSLLTTAGRSWTRFDHILLGVNRTGEPGSTELPLGNCE